MPPAASALLRHFAAGLAAALPARPRGRRGTLRTSSKYLAKARACGVRSMDRHPVRPGTVA